MLLHGIWDLSISMAHTNMAAQGGELAKSMTDMKVAGGVSISPIQILPGLLYGSFVLWRWTKRRERIERKAVTQSAAEYAQRATAVIEKTSARKSSYAEGHRGY